MVCLVVYANDVAWEIYNEKEPVTEELLRKFLFSQIDVAWCWGYLFAVVLDFQVAPFVDATLQALDAVQRLQLPVLTRLHLQIV